MSVDAPLRLVIEASTAAGSVALLHGADLLAERHVTLGSGTADVLYPAIVALCAEADVAPAQLAQVVCGEGPGSFTSLRIAASLAKGVALGAGVPLAAVSSLLLAAASSSTLPSGPIAVHADALRGERYVQWVDVHDGWIAPLGPAQRVTVAELQSATSESSRLAVLQTPDTLPGPVVRAEASALRRIVATAVVEVPVASWEPAYGRLAEAQVQWEQRHGGPLPDVRPTVA